MLLSEDKARKCAARVTATFTAYAEAFGSTPTLAPAPNRPGGWLLTWPDGPYEWPNLAILGGADEELVQALRNCGGSGGSAPVYEPITWPVGVEAEPVDNVTLLLYRAR